MRIVALAGGVGGAKMAHGLAQVLSAEELTILVNVGDDFDHFGLRICPDLDTVCYTLAGLANPATGWGRADESWGALETIGALGGPTWFRLGDRDLGVHLERTRRLASGMPLSQIVSHFCHAWGLFLTVLPVSDDSLPTWVYTDEGEMPFQEYFVQRQCRPKVSGFQFRGVEQARPAEGVLQAIDSAEAIVICPSNPWVSIDPILAVPGVKAALSGRPVYAISPIIGGKAIKGPAAKMFTELGIRPTASAVARHYADLLKGFILDCQDRQEEEEIKVTGLRTLVTDTVMNTPLDRQRLAMEVLRFAQQ